VAALSIAKIAVVRRGAALELGLSDGTVRVVRQKDLAEVLGEQTRAGPRFVAARVVKGAVEVDCADGESETLPASVLLADPTAERVDLVVDHAGWLMTCEVDTPGSEHDRLGLCRDGTVWLGQGRVVWAGAAAEAPRGRADVAHAHRIDAGGRLVTPGLVDPHTHLIFAGDRADEFARRAAGQSYREIAEAGGGILATLTPTRAADVEEHARLATLRLARALAGGTTTCEAKSGYALTVAGELALLEAALLCDALSPVDVVPTLLGAHALPPERAGDRAGFVADVAERMIPAAARARLCTSVDVYCDDGAFSRAETEIMLRAARAAGLPVRAHVGQFADLGGAELLAELGALSADHLENVSAAGIAALAAQHVVAVMLPGACVQLGLAPPPVAALREAGVPLALGTDLNPGSSCSESVPVQMWLATTHYRMTVEEAWLGATRHAALALGRHDIGCLGPGARADLVLWDAERPAEIPYHYGVNLVHQVIKAGRRIDLASHLGSDA
jgi:imidazolonepropionase